MSEIEYDNQPKPLPPIRIQPEQISPEALAAVIDSFIMREGTDYGTVELTHEAKVERLRRQIDKGDVIITYDPNSETVSLISKREARGLES